MSFMFLFPDVLLAAGDTSPEDIIRSVASGLYVTELIGFGVNMVTGDYSRGASGLWISGGELAYLMTAVAPEMVRAGAHRLGYVTRDIVSGAFFLMDDAFRLGEYIEVGQDKGHRATEALGAHQLAGKHLLALAPVGEAGERIGVRLDLTLRHGRQQADSPAQLTPKRAGARLW